MRSWRGFLVEWRLRSIFAVLEGLVEPTVAPVLLVLTSDGTCVTIPTTITLTQKPLQPKVAFNLFHQSQRTLKASYTWHHFINQLPTLSCFHRVKYPKLLDLRQSQAPLFSIPTDSSLSPAQLPNTRLSIAIADAIGSL